MTTSSPPQQRVVLITRAGAGSLPDGALRRLGRHGQVRVVQRSSAPDPDDAADLLADATVLACSNLCLPVLDDQLLWRTPRLRHVVLYATGHEHVDAGLLARYGVTLSALPRYATPAVAEHALAMLLSLAARVHLANDCSRGLAPADTSLRGIELHGRVLGVIGTGRIGSRVVELARGIGMQVLGTDPDPAAAAGAARRGAEVVGPGRLLRRSHAVALCASTTPGAAPILDAAAVRSLRPGALVVNVGRAQLVDTAALLAAIRTGQVRGYGVDDVVVGDDAPVADRQLMVQGRLLQTRHSAWWREEALERGAAMFERAVIAAAIGLPVDVVDADRVLLDQRSG